MEIRNLADLRGAGLHSLVGHRAKPAVTTTSAIRAGLAPTPKPAPSPAAKPNHSPGGTKVQTDAPSSTRRPADVRSAFAFGRLVQSFDQHDDMADSPARAAGAVLAKAKAQAAVFYATIKRLQRPVAPTPPPAGSQAARFLAAVAPKTTGPIQTTAGVAKPPEPGRAASRWMQVMKKLRGEI
jgi:hypothetical protein